MTRVVLDANQFVSALLKPGSNPARIISLVHNNRITLLLSDDIILEIAGVLLYPKIMKRHGQSAEYIKTFIKKIRSAAIITAGKLKIDAVKNDPSDNKYLSCALEGRADFIISGDRHLKDLKSYKNIAIVDPGTFLATIELKGQ